MQRLLEDCGVGREVEEQQSYNDMISKGQDITERQQRHDLNGNQ